MTNSQTRQINLYERICVRAPYFALQNLQHTAPGEATAAVPIELPPTRETSPISLAEKGRHLAILGLCAAASVAPNDQRRYYLARTASIRCTYPRTVLPSERLTAHAKGAFVSPREAAATTTLAAEDGAQIAKADFTYTVVGEPVFARAFAYAHRLDVVPTSRGFNPYSRELPLTDIGGTAQDIRASLTPTVADCAGHFEAYPTLPVAVLGGCMVNLASHVVDTMTGEPNTRWVPHRVDVDAQRLVAAGKTVYLSGRSVAVRDGVHEVEVQASSDGAQVAHLTVWAEPVNKHGV
ncbi:hypothetical protein ABZ863_13090 [Saccharomonospora sp. NPDC046836]|uniref:hypothetical protein n=1 Tax=Saccharomonospora sp. NPDC046836 TaxID=3156921 RepID=UPI0033FAB269